MTGRTDFDFLFGQWQVHNRKLVDLTEPGCTDWIEFQAFSDVRRLLDGLGNMDTFVTAELPGVGAFEGMSLRLYDPETELWKIWWASTGRPGHLDTPVEGRFVDGRGEFLCDDELNGRKIVMRFEWLDVTTDSPRWVQSFSYDGGETWETNWIMTLTRAN